MSPINKIDLGSVQVHKQALAETVAIAVSEIEGVMLLPKSPLDQAKELFGCKTFPGIDVKVAENEQVTINVKVNIRYGLNITEMARYVQTTVKAIIDKTMDVQIKDINVNVQGVERSRQ